MPDVGGMVAAAAYQVEAVAANTGFYVERVVFVTDVSEKFSLLLNLAGLGDIFGEGVGNNF